MVSKRYDCIETRPKHLHPYNFLALSVTTWSTFSLFTISIASMRILEMNCESSTSPSQSTALKNIAPLADIAITLINGRFLVSLHPSDTNYTGSFPRSSNWLKSFFHRNTFFLQKSITHLFKPRTSVIRRHFKDGCDYFLPIWRSYQVERKTIGIKAKCNCFINKLSCLDFDCLIQWTSFAGNNFYFFLLLSHLQEWMFGGCNMIGGHIHIALCG